VNMSDLSSNPQSLRRLVIVTPVFNDWESLHQLLVEIDRTLEGTGHQVEMLVVDDCSTVPQDRPWPDGLGFGRIDCLRLRGNMGHQRAIAIGLMTVAERTDVDAVIVLDSDGEDRPEDIPRLIAAAEAAPHAAVVAQRAQRSESLLFRLFYRIYLNLFRLLTGHRISFGNFSLLRIAQVRRIANAHHIWNNFAASIIVSKVPISFVPTKRGKRYAGQSKMNFVGLIAHGLGAISVFTETVFIRILIASLIVFVMCMGLAAATLYIKFATTLAVPNWATTVLGFALVISIQALMMPILMAFMLLSNRASIQPAPISFAQGFVAKVERATVAGADGSRQGGGDV